ncbi:UNVERIFIED_CONTAM: hypothetical protein K2H54_006747 [Gekko kuhli]
MRVALPRGHNLKGADFISCDAIAPVADIRRGGCPATGAPLQRNRILTRRKGAAFHPIAAAPPGMDVFYELEKVLDYVVCFAVLYFLSYSSLFLLYFCLLLPLAFILEEGR